MSKITLPDDPKASLEQISQYLRTLSTHPARAIRQDEEVIGFWQCSDWLDGLHDIADECDRLVGTASDPAAALKRPTSTGWWLVRHPEGWPNGCVARVHSIGEFGTATIWEQTGSTLQSFEANKWEWLRPLDLATR